MPKQLAPQAALQPKCAPTIVPVMASSGSLRSAHVQPTEPTLLELLTLLLLALLLLALLLLALLLLALLLLELRALRGILRG